MSASSLSGPPDAAASRAASPAVAAPSSLGGASSSILAVPTVTVQFPSPTGLIEDGGGTFEIPITISPAPTTSFQLYMKVAPANPPGATTGDYRIVSPSPLPIAAGQTTAEFRVEPVRDGIIETLELFRVSAGPSPDGSYNVNQTPSAPIVYIQISDGSNDPEAATPDGNQRDDQSHPEESCPCPVDVDPLRGILRYTPDLNGQPICGAPFASYHNLANPHPLLSADWNLPSPLPAKVAAELTFNGSLVSTTYFGTTGLSAGDRVHASIQYDASALATGSYAYTITLKSLDASNVVFDTKSVGGSTEVYNWAASPYGKGWWMQDLDRIVPGAGGALLVRGDATAGWFASAGGDDYTTPDGSTTTLTGNSTSGWTLARTDGGLQVFNAAGYLLADVDVDGGRSTYAYDGSNRLSGFSDPFGRLATYTYNGGGLLQTRSDLYGRVTSYAYDANGRVTSITQADPDGAGPETSPVTTLTYDSDGLLRTSVDPLGNATTFSYTSRLLTAVEHPGRGAAEQYAPVALQGLPGPGQGTLANPAPLVRASEAKASVTDATGRTTTIAYDKLGNPTEVTDPLGDTTYYDYNADGDLTRIITPDPDGAGPLGASVTDFAYDAWSNLTGVALPDGRTQSFEYEPGTRWLTSFTDEAGKTTSYTLNSTGHPTAVVDPLGRTTSYAYSSVAGVGGFLTSVTGADPEGPLTSPVTSYAYDSKGRLGTLTYPGGATNKFAYDSADNLTSTTDELGRRTTFTYDALGRRTSVVQPDPDGAGPLASPITTHAYDRRGLLTKTTDPLNRVVSYGYDAGGRLRTLTQPDPDGAGPLAARITTYAYDAADRLTTVKDPLNRTVTSTYDDAGRLSTVTAPDPDGAGPLTSPVTTFEYDAVGRRARAVDPLGRVTAYAYDDAGQLISVTAPDPDGAGPLTSPVTTYVYDKLGRTVAVVDPLGHATSYAYDSRDRLTTITDPRSGQTKQAYDAAGNLTSLTDPGGNRTTYVYDNLNRATTVVDPNGKSTVHAFDAVGNLLRKTDRLGRVVQFAYDGDDQVKTEAWLPVGGGAAVNTITYTYDAAGRMTQVQDVASKYVYAYDALDRLSTADNQGTPGLPQVTLTYSHDENGNRTSLVDSKGGRTSYAYDALDRLSRITHSGPGVANKRVDLAYDAAGQRTSLARSSDLTGTTKVVTTTYAYDGMGRVTGLSHKTTTQTRVSFGYSYDAAGRVVQENRSWNTGASTDVVSYGYADDDQLTSVSHANGAFAAENFSYDANGNRDSSGYATSTGNRTTADGTYTYTYDDEGNQTSRTETATGARTDYKWDHRNRLTEVFSTAAGFTTLQAAYTYDALDRRIGEASHAAATSPTVGDAGFEAYTAPGTPGYGTPTGSASAWTYTNVGSTGAAGVSADGTAYTAGNPDAPHGSQAAYILGNGSISQTISGWQAGTYTLTFLAAQRGNYPAGGLQALQIKLDGVVVGTITPSGPNYQSYSVTFAVATAGGHTISLVGASTTLGTALVDAASISSAPTSPTAANAGFETTGSWSFGANTGVTANGSAYTNQNPPAPQGSQVAYILGDGAGATLSQTISGWQPGTYTLTFLAAQRVNYPAGGRQALQVVLDDVTVLATVTPSGGDYETYSVVVPIATAGGHKISFVGTSTIFGTALVDAVALTATGATAANAGFETTGSWSFGANTGVTPNGSVYTNQNPPAPQGGQVAYILGDGAGATLSQTISGWQAGAYTLTFLAAQRANYPAGGLQALQVKVDGVVVGTITPAGADYRSYAATFVLTAGAHTIQLVGLSTTLGAALVDDVALVPTSPATRRWTVYDGYAPILDFNEAGTQTARYLQAGPDGVDEALARETAAGVAWYLPDRLGTIRDLVNNSGAVVDHVDYNPFGKALAETAPAVGDRLMGFAGMERGRATGLNLAVHRAQDPNTGRWLSEDPISFHSGDYNIYRYTNNSPVYYVDNSGLASHKKVSSRGGKGKVVSGGTPGFSGRELGFFELRDLKSYDGPKRVVMISTYGTYIERNGVRTSQDSSPIWKREYPKCTVSSGINSWNDVITSLNRTQHLEHNKILHLHLSGHGHYAGGIATGNQGLGPGLTAANLTPELASLITKRIDKNGVVIINGCTQGGMYDNGEMQKLANLFRRPVLATDGDEKPPWITTGSWWIYMPR